MSCIYDMDVVLQNDMHSIGVLQNILVLTYAKNKSIYFQRRPSFYYTCHICHSLMISVRFPIYT